MATLYHGTLHIWVTWAYLGSAAGLEKWGSQTPGVRQVRKRKSLRTSAGTINYRTTRQLGDWSGQQPQSSNIGGRRPGCS